MASAGAPFLLRPGAIAVTLAVALAPVDARAHQGSVALVALTARGSAIDARVGLAAADLADALEMMPGFALSRGDALEAREEVAAYVRRGLRLSTLDGLPCAPEGEARAAVVAEGLAWRLELALRWRCASPTDALRARYDLFFARDPRHRGVVTLDARGGPHRAVFDVTHREADLGRAPSLRAVMARFVAMGAEHILTGWDHLSLLVALLVAASARPLREAWRAVLGLVTAFTAAHSITLAAATLGWVSPPGRVVEVAIALSILAVCAENLRGAAPRGRVAVTFAFGLVHGFGFAGSLAEVGLPATAVAPALLAFNVGVELGQVAALLVAWPALRALARTLGHRRAVVVTSAALGVAAAWWAAQRAAG